MLAKDAKFLDAEKVDSDQTAQIYWAHIMAQISTLLTCIFQVAQGDSDAANVIMSINDKVNNDKLTTDQEQLLNQQTKEAESLEDRQLKEKREMNRNLDDEMATEEIDVETQIQQQKRLV